MKRIQSACIMQTIRFSQKDDAGYSVSHMSNTKHPLNYGNLSPQNPYMQDFAAISSP